MNRSTTFFSTIRRSLFGGWFLLQLLLSGCGTTPSAMEGATPQASTENVLVAVPWDEAEQALQSDRALEDWADALEASSTYYAKKAPASPIPFGSYTVTARDMRQAVDGLAKQARLGQPERLRHFLRDRFQLFRSVGQPPSGDVLVTAYYEPLLHGARTPSKKYSHPLYRRPADLLDVSLSPWFPDKKNQKIIARFDGKNLTPFYDREEIEMERQLAGKNLELAWVDDPIDLFFLQIQGSGRVQLDDGTTLRVGYHGANGHPYRSIGKILIQEGAIRREAMSLPALRTWLRDHPKEQDRILNANPSYVFFRRLDGGPYGNIAVPLTPTRSIATDHRLFPKGAPGLLKTTRPHFDSAQHEQASGWEPSFQFVVNQDTGGAIRGPGRVDLFMGFGQEAEQTAGLMKQSGSALYFIAPKPTGVAR